jgi:hypothetical protein
MMAPPRPRKGKIAEDLPQNAATFLNPEPSGIECGHHKRPAEASATGQAAMVRLLMARLDKLGLTHSGAEDDSILIAGQAYDLRSAAAMARQLGRAAA